MLLFSPFRTGVCTGERGRIQRSATCIGCYSGNALHKTCVPSPSMNSMYLSLFCDSYPSHSNAYVDCICIAILLPLIVIGRMALRLNAQDATSVVTCVCVRLRMRVSYRAIVPTAAWRITLLPKKQPLEPWRRKRFVVLLVCVCVHAFCVWLCACVRASLCKLGFGAQGWKRFFDIYTYRYGYDRTRAAAAQAQLK